ncbi:hypothetical protein L210DRAFT_3506848 [Boletus edulis BED1]|uniref:Uncharacterized protein n=1 Tax=Boletus edulis BED1 TaxID=1328754 RepID=A0AAD4BM26_BOLED|nr:hypothetical protein L210DRAFT_3506848 [Boletus edulis BED1]
MNLDCLVFDQQFFWSLNPTWTFARCPEILTPSPSHVYMPTSLGLVSRADKGTIEWGKMEPAQLALQSPTNHAGTRKQNITTRIGDVTRLELLPVTAITTGKSRDNTASPADSVRRKERNIRLRGVKKESPYVEQVLGQDLTDQKPGRQAVIKRHAGLSLASAY